VRKIKVGLVGIGGFGSNHLKQIRNFCDNGRVLLEAVCDKNIDVYEKNLVELNFNNIRKYVDYEAFLGSEKGLDLVIICTPIPMHMSMSCLAMEAGYNVLLEKPPAVTIQDIDKIIATKVKTGKMCFVGFQMTSCKSFVSFKESLQSDIIGGILKIAGTGTWCRDHGYFTRAPWVGKILYNGNYVLDGTVNNPLAHVLNNCLILAGSKATKDASPQWVQSELYKANDIESEDTSCLRVMTQGGTEVYFIATICGKNNDLPYIIVTGERGKGIWSYNGTCEFYDTEGTLIKRNSIISDSNNDHYENIISYLQGLSNKIPCNIEDTRNFVLVSNLAFESSKITHKIDKQYLDYLNTDKIKISEINEKTDFLYLRDIEKIVEQAVVECKLFSELGVAWAVETSRFYAENYTKFELYK